MLNYKSFFLIWLKCAFQKWKLLKAAIDEVA